MYCVLTLFYFYFFPKVAQSTRSIDGGQDDYLGGVDIPVRDLPPTGLDRWYKLEGKFIFGHFVLIITGVRPEDSKR